MGRTHQTLCYSFVLIALTSWKVEAQQRAAYDLLPDSTQAVARIADGDDLLNRWHRTTIHHLSEDPAIRPFFEEQQELLRNRLMDAGWRLGVKPDELAQYLHGQIAVAWLEKTDERKPYALALIADVDDDPQINAELIGDIERALAHRDATKKEHKHLEQSIVQFTLPRKPGQLLEESTYIATVSGHLLASDDLALVQQLIDRLQGQEVTGKTIAEDSDFVASREHLQVSGKAQIEYFVRPLGIARIIRAIGGTRSKNDADVLEVLRNQGFASVKSIAGEIWLAEGDSDLAHRGFVYADFPLPRSAAVLDFPNETMSDVPNFVTKSAASFFTISWNVQTAFWKVRDLVDDLVGNPGVFDEVIHGIKTDINGPQVDIRTELLPLLTNDIVSMTDNQEGEINVGSRRNLIGIKVNDWEKASKILDRVMKAEAHAEKSEFAGIAIWRVTNEPEDFSNAEFDDFADFGDFEDSSDEDAEEETEDPWLNHWAIAVLPTDNKEGYFLFASHGEMLEEAIAQSKSGEGGLTTEADYQRIRSAVVKLMNSETPCAWNITRNHLSLRVQYELFRQGKLADSESMLATVLNRLKAPVDETTAQPEKTAITGHSLPPFEKIAEYLNPSGFKLLATPHGWEFGGILLGDAKSNESGLSATNEGSTARIVETTSEAKR